MSQPNDLTNQTFGSLTFSRRAGSTGTEGNLKALWEAACTCGGKIIGRSDHLRKKGHCGCQRKYESEVRKPVVYMPPPPPPEGPIRTREEIENMTARQMKTSGEKWSAVASYLGIDVETAKQRLSA